MCLPVSVSVCVIVCVFTRCVLAGYALVYLGSVCHIMLVVGVSGDSERVNSWEMYVCAHTRVCGFSL